MQLSFLYLSIFKQHSEIANNHDGKNYFIIKRHEFPDVFNLTEQLPACEQGLPHSTYFVMYFALFIVAAFAKTIFG